jgi:hypothetical protein
MTGFHNSFNAYCDWCEKQTELELPTMSWGDWWDTVADKEVICDACGELTIKSELEFCALKEVPA